MKTYKTVVNKPMLEIYHDNDSESPRQWTNLGYFITVDKNQNSPDKEPILESIVKWTGEEADSLKNHIKAIEKEANAVFVDEKVIAIYPIVKYEHSNIYYSLGKKHGFDYSNNGFYIITDKTQKIVGTPKGKFEKVIQQELKEYNQWINGEVYGYIFYNESGESDNYSGFYSLDDIKSELPKEWEEEDLEQYLIN